MSQPLPSEKEPLFPKRSWLPGTVAIVAATLSTILLGAIASRPNTNARAASPSRNPSPLQIPPLFPQRDLTVLNPFLPFLVAPPESSLPTPQPTNTALNALINHALIPPLPKSSITKIDAERYARIQRYLQVLQGLQQVAKANAEAEFFPMSSDTLAPEQGFKPSPTPSETAQNLPTQTSTPTPINLNLNDIVILAVENNLDIKNAYLERIAQRQDLAVAEDKFVPNFTPRLSVSTRRDEQGNLYSSLGETALEAIISSQIPTGGNFSFTWKAGGRNEETNSLFANSGNNLNQDFKISFRQPLMRGAGIELNRASIETARLTEAFNVIHLRATLSDTVNQAIVTYLQLVQAQEQLKIAENSLTNSRRLLEVTKALIEAGRVAPVEQVQSEADIANQEVQLLSARNTLESAQLQLIELLDIDRNLRIIANLPNVQEPPPLEAARLKEIALNNNPSYLQAQLRQKILEYDLRQAADARRWNLDFDVSYNGNRDTERANLSDVRAGLILGREFGDLTVEQRFQRQRVNLQQAQNNFKNISESLEIQISDRLQEVKLIREQIDQAKLARELAEKQLVNEQFKLTIGSSSIQEVVRFQNELARARNSEIQATIDYFNALTRLDQTLGTTLATWRITLEEESPPPRPSTSPSPQP